MTTKSSEIRNWVKINDDAIETYNTNIQIIKFKNTMLRLSLHDYSDAYILVKETNAVPKTGTAAATNNRNVRVIFKNYSPFTDCLGEIINIQVDNWCCNEIDVEMPMYNLLEYW